MTEQTFNPYRKWFGINEHKPNHYRLLGIDLFENDPDVIDAAANARMSYLQQFNGGEHAELAERIQGEIAKARLTLLNAEKKQAYDAKLKQAAANAPSEPPFGTSAATPARHPKQKSSSPVLALVVLVLIAGGIGGWQFLTSDKQPPKVNAPSVAKLDDPKPTPKSGDQKPESLEGDWPVTTEETSKQGDEPSPPSKVEPSPPPSKNDPPSIHAVQPGTFTQPTFGWISLTDDKDRFRETWKPGHQAGQFFYDPDTKRLSIDSPHDLSHFYFDGAWRAFGFDVEIDALSFGQFTIQINGVSIKLDGNLPKGPGPVAISLKYDDDNHCLVAQLNGEQVSKATVLESNWNSRFRCTLSSSGGQNARLTLSKVRLMALGDFGTGVANSTKTDPPSSPRDSDPPPQPSDQTAPRFITNSVGMKLALIPPGEFLMGSQDGGEDEQPAHIVKITKPFYLGAFEVTQQEYEAVMDGINPASWRGLKHPVTNVSWHDANEFFRRLSLDDGRVYRLPTEAEWEYASRGGSRGKWCFGNSDKDVNQYAWYSTNSANSPHPVGQLKPNGFGLHDMHGNVGEWCSDRYSSDFYQNSPTSDPTGPSVGRTTRVCRGGTFFDTVSDCRSAFRGANSESASSVRVGFRVVCMVDAGLTVAEFRPSVPEGDDESTPTAYDTLWSEVMPLLADRKYPAAITTLEDAASDPAYADYKDNIAADKAGIEKVMTLFPAAEQGVMKLKPGDTIKVKGIGGLRFVKYDSERKVIVTSFGGSDKETPLIELNAIEIEDFAQKGTSDDGGTLALAVFHVIDGSGDLDRARDLLDVLQPGGCDVAKWSSRLGTRNHLAKRVSPASAQQSSARRTKPQRQAPRFTYLSQLQERDVKVAHPGWFSKDGTVTLLSVRDRPMMMFGERCPHSLFMHPPRDGFSRVAFPLDKPYSKLRALAAIPIVEQHPRQGNAVTPLTFEVLGNGTSIWRSLPLTLKGASQQCEVSLKGIAAIELRVYCPGPDSWAVAAWIEPQLYE